MTTFPLHHGLTYLNVLPRIYLILLSIWLIPLAGISQRPQYKIIAELNTSNHTVSGTIDIAYTNRSEFPLDSLGIHLWPNAYKSKSSALIRQMLNMGNLNLYRAPDSDLGGFIDIQFNSASHDINWKLDTNHIDIGWLHLSKPLLPGETINFSSTFSLKVPKSFSRIGRTGDSYQLTQWYPHIAVYDEEGWHTMPYLDYGEYFNDFADYEVTLQVPPMYDIAATGLLISNTVQDGYKEWKFRAENVIDFAWFASPTFMQEKYHVDVGGEKDVELNLYIEFELDGLWDRAHIYAQRALKFYSDWLGPYPYPQMSVVYTPWSKAGYMEYPMVAQISYTEDSTLLDIAIAHEIGHTWIYGILANDERRYPWLDEGLNTFIERRYTEKFHPDYKEPYLPSFFEHEKSMPQMDSYQHMVRFNGDLQPPMTDPEFQQGDQYLFSAYTLPAQGLEIMMSMVGEDMMMQMFRKYFVDHKFSHVSPEDLQQSFESECQCDLNWFFKEWLYHAHEVDYRIKRFDPGAKEVTIENKSGTMVPLRITSYRSDKQQLNHWLKPFKGEKTFHLDKRADEVRLYDEEMVINKKWNKNIKPRSWIPSISFLPKIGSYETNIIGISPFFGYNVTDGIMPGVMVSSGIVPQSPFKLIVAPMYGLESHSIRGHAEGRYIGDVSGDLFDKILLSLSYDQFGYDVDTHYLFRDHYERWSPTLAFRMLPRDDHSQLTQWWKYRFVSISQHYGQGIDYEAGIYSEKERSYGIHELSYTMSLEDALAPFTVSANIQGGKGFLRLNLNYKQHFVGMNKYRGIWVRGYGGWLPVFDEPDANVKLEFNGISSSGFFSKDYMYDEWLGGRNAVDGFFAHQVFIKDAGLKTLSTMGVGDDWMIGAGFSAALPFRWIHFYMDAAAYTSAITEKTQLSYSGGLAIVLVKDIFEIYIPILESQDILESLTYEVRDQWYDRVSFQANFKLFNPLNALDHYQLGY